MSPRSSTLYLSNIYTTKINGSFVTAADMNELSNWLSFRKLNGEHISQIPARVCEKVWGYAVVYLQPSEPTHLQPASPKYDRKSDNDQNSNSPVTHPPFPQMLLDKWLKGYPCKPNHACNGQNVLTILVIYHCVQRIFLKIYKEEVSSEPITQVSFNVLWFFALFQSYQSITGPNRSRSPDMHG